MFTRRKILDPFDLDTELLRFTPKDPWAIRSACEGVIILGAIGSGKTSGSGAAIAHSYLSHGFGGVVCCSKPEERTLWEGYAKATGRTLVIIEPGGKWLFNFLDYELQRPGGGGQTENIVNMLSDVIAIAEGKRDQGGDNAFWDRAMKELLRNAVDLLSIARGTITLDAVANLINDAPQKPLIEADSADQATPAQVAESDRWWAKSFCAKLIIEATEKLEAKQLTAIQAHDFETASRYWLSTFPRMSERTRSGIVATFTSIADMLLRGEAWRLYGGETTIVPEVTYTHGAIIVLDFSVQQWGELGRIIQGIFKLMFQRAILRRNVTQYPRPVFLWADEAQEFVSGFDYKFQSVARSARAATVYLTQNISNFYSVLKSRDETHALLGNFQTKIFHANGDFATNQWAADVISMEKVVTLSFGSGGNTEDDKRHQNASGSEQIRYKVLPAEFTTLRKGGAPNGGIVEAIIFQGGNKWRATGDTYVKTSFRQR